VLEIQNGIVVADRSFQQTLGITGCAWIDDFQPRRVKKRHLGILRVKRSASHAAADRAAHHHWNRTGVTPARRRDIVGQRFVRAGDEIHELHFDNWPHAHVSRARGRAGEAGFADRRIDNAFVAEVLKEAFSYLEGAAVKADVFAQ
jgi:hypothetical protein